MIIRLHNLTIQNFCGIKDFSYDFEGKSAQISGQNKSRKSTIYNAVSYLFFDKDQFGKAKFGMKPRDVNGEELHGLVTVVEATLMVDEKKVTIRKEIEENWVKRHDSVGPKVLDGNVTRYVIDGAKVKKAEFDKAVKGIVGDEKLFRTMSNVLYFNDQVSPADRRKILIDFDGGKSTVTPSSEIAEMLGTHDVDVAIKIRKDRKSELMAKAEGNEQAIKSLKSTMPSESSTMPVPGPKKEELEKELESVIWEKANAAAGDNSSVHQEISRLRSELAAIEDRNRAKKHAESEEVEKIRRDASQLAYDIDAISRDISRYKSDAEEQKKVVAGLRVDWDRLKNTRFDVCYECGAVYEPESTLFSEAKSRRAEREKEIISAAEKAKAKIADYELKIRALNSECDQKTSRLQDLQSKANNRPVLHFEDTSDILTKISNLEKSLSENVVDVSGFDEKIVALKAKIKAHDEHDIARKTANNADLSIIALKAAAKGIGKDLDKTQLEINALTEYRQSICRAVEESVSKMFSPIKFNLFRENGSGNIEEVCETMIPDEHGSMVPWDFGASTGQKNIAGLSIIRTMEERYGVSVPVFVDNVESITSDIPEFGQIITMRAVPGQDLSITKH